ncbi:hypothetical protein HGM15179_010337 [Zosterops borbonicus]|uniref:Uncharacterized protein n=1 Tax=Zosterops borbonicus TaxID=364589 RepID=A0A8K1GFJ4_9PASS|nr:hypothetical protein HGM15179_010337 [Zosterops borbonicus]
MEKSEVLKNLHVNLHQHNVPATNPKSQKTKAGTGKMRNLSPQEQYRFDLKNLKVNKYLGPDEMCSHRFQWNWQMKWLHHYLSYLKSHGTL